MGGPFQFVKLFVFIALSTSALATPQMDALFGGRYVGVLRHTKQSKDQLARLEFIASEESGSLTQLMAVLMLHFGDFTTGEYVTYHFDNVRFNALTQQLVFDQPDQPIALVTHQFAGGAFVGNLRSAQFGDVGTLYLKKDGVA